MPSRRECAPCRRAGHCCPGMLLADAPEGGGLEWVCADCIEGEPCVAARCAGQGRVESSVRQVFDAFGGVEFAGDTSQVIQRSAAELGIAPVVESAEAASQGLLGWTPDPQWRQAAANERKSKQACKPVRRGRRRVEAPLRTIRGVQVRMPAESVIGAELIDLIANEKGELREVPTGTFGWRTPEEVREKIVAELATASNVELSLKYKVSKTTISAIRKQAGVKGRPGPRRAVSTIQRVEMDPQREGTASSMLKALAKRDASVAVVSLTLALNMSELEDVIDKLGPAQKAAFMSAGLKAALLA